jgi:MFS family permease
LPQVVPYRELWASNRNFRFFFKGQLVSFLGDWFTTIALYSSVAALTSSALALTLVLVCKTLPVFLIAPIAGPLVDRLDRRRILLATDFGRCGFALAYIFMHQLGSLAGLYVCATGATLLAGIAIPAKQSVLPRIVSAEAYSAANAMGGASWAGMLTLGAALGGGVTALLGIELSFLIDAATFLLSASFFYRLPPQKPPRKEGDETGFVEALRYLALRPTMAAQALIKTCQSLAGGVFALIPIFGGGFFEDRAGPLWLGLLYAIRGLGTLIGTLWMRILIGDSHSAMRASLVFAFAGQGVLYFLLSLATAYWQACLLYALSGLLQGMVWVFAGTLLQVGVDPRFHGRVFAMEFGSLTLSLALSSLLAGLFIDSGWGPQSVVALMAPVPVIGLVLSFYVWLAER